MNTPPDVQGAEGSQICRERPARAGTAPLSSHCPAVGHQDCPDTGNPGGDFPWSLLKINPVTNSSCCQHQALSRWEKPWLCHRTRASVPSLPVPQATDRPPIQALWVLLQQGSRVSPLTGPELSHTGGPTPPPVCRLLCRNPEKLLPFALSAWSLEIWEGVPILVKPASTEHTQRCHVPPQQQPKLWLSNPCQLQRPTRSIILPQLGRILVVRTTNP